MSYSPAGLDLREDLRVLVDPSRKIGQYFKGRIIAPPIRVSKTSQSFAEIPMGESEQPADLTKNLDGSWKRFQLTYGSDGYTTEVRGLEYPVNQISEVENSDWFNQQVNAANKAYKKLMIDRELRVATPLLTESNYATGTRYVTAVTYYTDHSNSVPKYDVDALAAKVLASSGLELEQMSYITTRNNVEDILKSEDYLSNSRDHVDVNAITAIDVKASLVAGYLGVKEVIPTSAVINTSNFGANAAAFTRLWSDKYSLLVLLPDSLTDWSDVCGARSPVYTKYAADYLMESYLEKARDQLIIRASDYAGTKFFWDYCFMIKGVRA